jgi:hypothetical protein
MTRSLFGVLPLKPRADTAQEPLLLRATCTPSARASASASVVTPARRMSSPVMTDTAAAAVPIGSTRRPGDVTSICISSSIESRFRSCGSGWDAARAAAKTACDRQNATAHHRPAGRRQQCLFAIRRFIACSCRSSHL